MGTIKQHRQGDKGMRIDIVCPKCDASRFAVRHERGHLKLMCCKCNHHLRFVVGGKENGKSKN